jgi:hypothetical protein
MQWIRRHSSFIMVGFICTVLIVLPYLFAIINAPERTVFSGFLLNPQDGNSYLAKMQEGRSGSWLFQLKYSPEDVDGAPLFTYYILLGHIARLLNVSNLMVFHAARVVNAWILLTILARLTKKIFPNDTSVAAITYAWMCLGGGMGYLIAAAKPMPLDFWVAEAYPFLSMLQNPHFPLGLALLVGMILNINQQQKKIYLAVNVILSLLLAVILPFGIVLLGAIVFIWTVINFLRYHRLILGPFITAITPGGIIVIMQYIWTLSDPFLRLWNEQNITSTGPIWNFLLSFMPALLFAAFFVVRAIKQKEQGSMVVLLVIWLLVGAVLSYIPFPLQRRFVLGYQIPAVLLAGLMLESIRQGLQNWRLKTFPMMAFLLSLPSIVLVQFGIYGAIAQESALLYYPRALVDAISWIGKSSHSSQVVLSSSDQGLLIPAYSNNRVVYGHPFESIDAVKRKQHADEIFVTNGGNLSVAIMEHKVSWIICAVEDMQIVDEEMFPKAYSNSGYIVYKVGK